MGGKHGYESACGGSACEVMGEGFCELSCPASVLAFMIQDLRFGLKLLWKEKGFTLTALATLALCIGANTAIFTVLHAVLLAPLPFERPEQLVTIGNIYPGAGISKSVQSSIPDYF